MVEDALSYRETRFDKKCQTLAEIRDENLDNASNMKEKLVDFLSKKNLIVYNPSRIPECTVHQYKRNILLKCLLEL